MVKHRILALTLGFFVFGMMPFSKGYSQTYSSDLKFGEQIDFVVLPSPFEMMIVLSAFGQTVPLPAPVFLKTKDPSKLAMASGIVAADIIASIKERNKAKTLEFSKILFSYAKELQVDDKLLQTYPVFVSAVESQDWNSAFLMVNEMIEYVNLSLQKGQFANAAKLANVAGWLEGLYLVCETLKQDFDPDKAYHLLQYEDLLLILVKQYAQLPDEIKLKPDYKMAIITLKEVSDIVSGKTSFSLEDIEKLTQITKTFRDSVHLI